MVLILKSPKLELKKTVDLSSPASMDSVTVTDSDNIDFTLTNTDITAQVKLDAVVSNNILTTSANGLKPIDLAELKKAIKRYRSTALNNKNLHLALLNQQTKRVSNHQLILKTQEGEINLRINDIIRLKGESNYSYIYLKDGKKSE